MKKSQTWLAFGMSALLALGVMAFASCGEDDSTVDPDSTTEEPSTSVETADFSVYTADDWLAEDFTSKSIDYQFTGDWSLEGEYAMNYEVLLNLYSDGSLLADARNTSTSSNSYLYYGYWSETETEDGKEISADTKFGSDLEGGLVAHEYSYTLYEESDGGFSFAFTFYLAPGQYFRTADMTGGTSIQYSSLDAFHAAVDVVSDDTEDPETETETLDPEGDVLLSWEGTYCTLECYANGVYEFTYTNMSVSETGTWSWQDWLFTLTTGNGNVITATMDSESYALVLEYVADMSSQLKDTFTCSASAWGAAFGGVGTYTPAS